MGFRKDYDILIKEIKSKIFSQWNIVCLQYDYYPWHGYSAISLRTTRDKSDNAADWELFEIATSDGEYLEADIEAYTEEPSRLTYHKQLCEAATVMLNYEYPKFMGFEGYDGIFPKSGLKLSLYDPDESITFNYCEFIVCKNHSSCS